MRLGLLILAAVALAPGQARAADTALTPDAAARLAWTLSDLVLDKHVEPPVRQEMLLGAARNLLHASGQVPQADLGRQVSGITTQAEFAALLKTLWPQVQGDAPRLKAALADGVLHAATGNTRRLTAQEAKIQDQLATNRYVGVGIQVRVNPEEKAVQVMTAFPRGPARKYGMKADDLIEKVEDVNVIGMPLPKVVELLRGEVGTTLTVVVRQPGTQERRTLKIPREVVPFERLVGYRRAGEEGWTYRPDPQEPVAYVRASGLTSSAVHELRRIEQQLQADGCKALVLDLRDCNDAESAQVALAADAFLDGGTMWRLTDARGHARDVAADRDCLFRGWPIAVLIDATTGRTGAWMLAAALQDSGRATLVGSPAEGDAFVRSLVPLPDGLGPARMPTARVLRTRPLKTTDQPARGDDERPALVEPDHPVGVDGLAREAVRQWNSAQDTPQASPKGDGPPADPVLKKAQEILRPALKTR